MYPADNEKAMQSLTSQLLKQADRAPDTEEAADKIITDLSDAIRYYDWMYYVQSTTALSDFDYDKLFKLLKSIEAKYPSLQKEDSPTQRVAFGLSEDFPTVQHNIPMLSLENSYNEEDLRDFDTRLRKLVGNEGLTYCVEPKFDGSSIALVYENDKLVRAATRGDGTNGEDITANAKALKSIPLSAPFSKLGIAKVEVRGEVIIRNDVFAKMNEQRAEQGLRTFQNARNTASGGLRMKDPNETARRGMEAFMYQIGYAIDKEGNNLLGNKLLYHSENIQQLYKLGFKVPTSETKVFDTIEGVRDFIHEWNTKRNDYHYLIDGMVIKLDNIRKQMETGFTSHHPRWALAFKFKASEGQTQLLNVEYQVGRTGAVTPVAKLAPVFVAGVTITSVSLHNEDFIAEKDIRIGDTVMVERAGEVIPYIAGVVVEKRTGDEQPIQFPTTCPSCESKLVKPEEEAIWRCVNIDCPAQQEERIIHFVSKAAMDIDNMGREIVVSFMQEGIIKHVTDIYQLDYDWVAKLEGWKAKSINNLKKGIEDSKSNPSWRVLVALGIRHVGTVTAKAMSRNVQSILDYKDWTLEQLTELEDVGPKVAESIHEFFNNEGNIATIVKLQGLGVNIERTADEMPVTEGKLQGKTFLFTGSLTRFTRDEAKELVEKNAGQLLSGVSKNLNYLVAGAEAGSKLDKAKKIPSITVIDEDQFLEMIA